MKKWILFLSSALLVFALTGCAPQLILLGMLSSAPTIASESMVPETAPASPITPTPELSSEPEITPNVSAPKVSPPAEPQNVLAQGDGLTLADVRIEYTDGIFLLTNEGTDFVRVTGSVVGVKVDGSYEYLTSLSLMWPDETRYARELEENGWAIKSTTNLLRPGESVRAEPFPLGIYIDPDAVPGEEGFWDPDVDGDGFYDVIFTISPQPDEDTLMFSTNDPVSDVYKLRVSDFEDKITVFK